MFKLMKDRREEGFSLMEILIAIGIVAILAAVAIPNITGFLNRGTQSALVQFGEQAGVAIVADMTVGGKFAPTGADANAAKTAAQATLTAAKVTNPAGVTLEYYTANGANSRDFCMYWKDGSDNFIRYSTGKGSQLIAKPAAAPANFNACEALATV